MMTVHVSINPEGSQQRGGDTRNYTKTTIQRTVHESISGTELT